MCKRQSPHNKVEGVVEADRQIVWCGGAGPPAARAHRARPRSTVATMLTSCAVVVLAASLATASGVDVAQLDLDINNTLPAEQYFIDKIFDKYGDKGIITFEVSLQLRRIVFTM